MDTNLSDSINSNDDTNSNDTTNLNPYSERYVRFIEAWNKLKPFNILNIGNTNQEYQCPCQVTEFIYYKGKKECDCNYEQFMEYLLIVNEFQQAFEQFKKNY